MEEKHLTPLKAIRIKCLECAGRPKEVRLCETSGCSLYIFRMGKNPNRSGIGGKSGSSAEKSPTQVVLQEEIR